MIEWGARGKEDGGGGWRLRRGGGCVERGRVEVWEVLGRGCSGCRWLSLSYSL